MYNVRGWAPGGDMTVPVRETCCGGWATLPDEMRPCGGACCCCGGALWKAGGTGWPGVGIGARLQLSKNIEQDMSWLINDDIRC